MKNTDEFCGLSGRVPTYSTDITIITGAYKKYLCIYMCNVYNESKQRIE